MPLLLVDDRDGRILAPIERREEAQGVLEAWARDDGSIPEYLCLVAVESHYGAIMGADTSVTIRPLQD